MKNIKINILLLLTFVFIACNNNAQEKKELKRVIKQTDTTKSHINKNEEINQIKSKHSSDLRPDKPVILNRIYTDTIEFLNYYDNLDYFLLNGKKNEKDIALIYNWYWNENDKYNFKNGDILKVKWKMAKIMIAGDEEILHFQERAIDAEKIISKSKPSNSEEEKASRKTIEEKRGIIITKIDSLKYSKNFCCILSPKEGFITYNEPNGEVIGKIKRIGNKEENNQYAYEIYFVSEENKVKINDYFQVGYETFALKFIDFNNGFVKIENKSINVWLNINEIKQLGFKAINWIDYLVSNSEKVLGYYANEPGLRIRTEPNTTSKIIGSVRGDLFEIKLTKNISGQWAKVKITKYKEHPCNTELNKKENIEYKTEGWMKIIDDNGAPNLWNYAKGC